jgi:hypothetical protein
MVWEEGRGDVIGRGDCVVGDGNRNWRAIIVLSNEWSGR